MSLWDSITSGLDSAFAGAAPVSSNLLSAVSQSASSVGRAISDKAAGAWDATKTAGAAVLDKVGSLADSGFTTTTLDPKSVPGGRPSDAKGAGSAALPVLVGLALLGLGGLWLTRKKG